MAQGLNFDFDYKSCFITGASPGFLFLYAKEIFNKGKAPVFSIRFTCKLRNEPGRKNTNYFDNEAKFLFKLSNNFERRRRKITHLC